MHRSSTLLPHCRRAVVVAGGVSAEREVSLQSGAEVSRALAETRTTVRQLDPRDTPLSDFAWQPGDIAFLALHGTYGEDGGAQQALDRLGVRYTGSGAAASQLAFDKLAAKRRFLSLGLPTPNWRRLPAGGDPFPVAASFGFPLVLKPVAQGSSLGVHLVGSPAEFDSAWTAARQFGDDLFLERAIPGEEWTVPVLNGQSLPPIHISTPHLFFDFTAKYAADSTDYDITPLRRHGRLGQLADLAAAACRALGGCGMCRVDLRVDPRGRPWLLEVNTLPGLTAHSLVPKSARAWGWSMPELCCEILRAA